MLLPGAWALRITVSGPREAAVAASGGLGGGGFGGLDDSI